jgi:uncharacterized protein
LNAPVHIRLSDQPVLSWRNGGGSMSDLWVWPAASGWDSAWRCRISVATIDRSGPFSSFPGVGRWFALLDGDGVALDFQDRSIKLQPGDPACFFEGNEAPQCRLLGAPARALNLMVQASGTGNRLAASGMMAPLESNHSWSAGKALQSGLFTTAAGRLYRDGHHAIQVAAQSLVWSQTAEAGDWRFEADSVRSTTAPAALSTAPSAASSAASSTASATASSANEQPSAQTLAWRIGYFGSPS